MLSTQPAAPLTRSRPRRRAQGDDPQREVAGDLPVVPRFLGLLQQRRAPPGRVADREGCGRSGRPVVAPERAGRRRMTSLPGGLGDIVDGDHEVEARPGRRRARRRPGVEATGLPATQTSALTWPAPGWSSPPRARPRAFAAELRQPARTRECQAPRWPGADELLPTTSIAGLNIVPPGRSRLPVRRVDRLQRGPLRDAPCMPACSPPSARAWRRSVRRRWCGEIGDPFGRYAARLRRTPGVNGSTAARTASMPSTYAGAWPGPRRGSCDDREQDKRIGARADGQVVVGDLRRLGPARVDDDEPAPRALVRAPARKSGTVMIEPLLAIGLVPISTSRSVRSMSGIGSRNWWP